MKHDAITFVTESNKIEGILRTPTAAEINEFHRFMELGAMNVNELERFVKVYQPDAKLRDKPNLNVRVGNHYPPSGGPEIRRELAVLLNSDKNPFQTHIAYETLHPFTDGNGRSGRMLWAWQMRNSPRLDLGFLHAFYYQTLNSAPSLL